MKKIEMYINGHLYQGNYDILKDALDKLDTYRKTSFLSKPFIASEVNINGSTLGSLCRMGLIKKVGERKVWLQRNEETMKLQSVNEYLIISDIDCFKSEVDKWVVRHYVERIAYLAHTIKEASAKMQDTLFEMTEIGIEMRI